MERPRGRDVYSEGWPGWAQLETTEATRADVYRHGVQVEIPALQEWARQTKTKLDAQLEQDAQAA